MPEFDQPHVLAVGLDKAFAQGATPSSTVRGGDHDDLDPQAAVHLSSVATGMGAFEQLKSMRYDLMVTGSALPDMDLTAFIRKVKATWPWQRWAMAGSALDEQDERTARTLGALAVLDDPSQWQQVNEVARSLHARSAAGRATFGVEQASRHRMGLCDARLEARQGEATPPLPLSPCGAKQDRQTV